MIENFQPEYRYAELDQDLLLTPYKIQTNWHVITGAPSCGKTTLINLLASRGFNIVPETAHEYLKGELKTGKSITEVFSNRFELQYIFIKLQKEVERKLEENDLIFLDRALPDSLTFNRISGLDPNDLLLDCFHYQYASVYILDPLPFYEDGVRDEDKRNVEFLDEWIARDYQALGYRVIRVPVLTPEERVKFVLDYLSGLD
jgi:predicted ATPase